MNIKTEIIMMIAAVLTGLTFIAIVILGVGSFKQCEMVYYHHDYDLDKETGLISVKVEGQTLSVDADKIIFIPTDCESGNALYIGEYKTLYFTKTYYDVDRFVILIPRTDAMTTGN